MCGSPPLSQIDSSTVSNDLRSIIRLAGLPPSVFTPRSFRPTGATIAVHEGNSDRDVRQLMRLNTEEVFFYQHYSYPTSGSNITDSILSSELNLSNI